MLGDEQTLHQRPIFGVFSTYQSPLVNTDEDVGNLLWAVEHDIPVIYLGGPIIGLTSPMTGASTLTLTLATALSGLAIAQLKRPGAAVAIGGSPCPADLRTSRMAYGSPEMSLYTAAFADLCRHLEIPCMGTAGASESKVLDAQAAIESTIQLLFSTLSGTPLVHDLGFLDGAELGSLAHLIMLDEVISMIKRMMRGVTVNADTIMLDLIEKIGPGGHFMRERRSAMLCRQEVWVPTLMDREHNSTWIQQGGTSMEQRVQQRLLHILNTHMPDPLGHEVVRCIDDLLAGAERRMY